jgi:hypothetical protein
MNVAQSSLPDLHINRCRRHLVIANLIVWLLIALIVCVLLY